MKRIFQAALVSTLILLTACAPRAGGDLPPSLVATMVAEGLTQTALPAAATPAPASPTAAPSSPTAQSQALPPRGLKPADSEAPASGICGEAQGAVVDIVLGSGPDGLPLAGRCLIIHPAQRLHLINQSGGLVEQEFAGYEINLAAGGEMLLDQPVGDYLALGVHFLPLGPELWLKAAEG